MSDTLLLNANYLPLAVISRKKAFKLIFKDKASIVTEYDDWKMTAETMVPAVIRLRDLVTLPSKMQIKFSRENIYIRDKYTCQYCGKNDFKKSDLTFDHVLPKSRGGKTTFNNIVTACNPCNARKADRTPEEANMHLAKYPEKPAHLFYAMYRVAVTMSHPSWIDFTGMYLDMAKA